MCVCVRERERERDRDREREREKERGTLNCIHLQNHMYVNFASHVYRFMDAGGWPMLNMWLVEAKKAQNTALLIELLQVHQLEINLHILRMYIHVAVH